MSDSASLDLPVYCIHLRARSMYYGDTFDPDSEEFQADPHCWCQRTMEAIGPDDGLVTPETCQPGRSCFEGIE